MHLYLAKNKVKSGPFTQLQVKEKLAAGEFDAGDLGWHEGLDRWKPLLEIPVAAEIITELVAERSAEAKSPSGAVTRPASVASVDEELGCKQVRPFVRFFARFLDLFIFSAIAWIAVGGYEIPDPPKTEAEVEPFLAAAQRIMLVEAAILFAWNFVDAWLLSAFGTTLGKNLLRIEVRNQDGSRLRYGPALLRSFHVWLSGYACGVPLFRELIKIICFIRLVKDGITPWDRAQNLRVTHRRIGERRIMAAALIVLGVALLMNFAMTR
jgi:uncharacterized RDD family membrane protein YckC